MLPVLLLLMATACTVGPDYTPPQLAMPESWEGKSTESEQLASLSYYWKQLNDPVLDNLISEAERNNLTLKDAYHRIEEAAALRGLSRSQYFPDLDLDGELRRSRRSEAVASPFSQFRNDFLSLGGLLNWEIDVLGRVRRLNESAQATMEARTSDYYATLVFLHSQIVATYSEYRTLQRQIELTHDNIRTQQESLRLAKDRFTAGVAPELDVYQAESNLGQTEAALPVLRTALARARHRLAVLIGGFPESADQYLEDTGSIPEVNLSGFSTLPVDILRQRPDVRSAERELAAEHALIGAREAERYPILTLPGQFSFEAINSLEKAFRSGSLAYSIGPSLRWNLFDGGLVESQIEAQESRTAQRKVQYIQRVLSAVQEVEDAIVALREEKIRRESLKESTQASLKAVQLVKVLYVSGYTDFQNVLDSERRLFEQQINLAQSRGNMVRNFVELFRALGGGWQEHNLLAADPGPEEVLPAQVSE